MPESKKREMAMNSIYLIYFNHSIFMCTIEIPLNLSGTAAICLWEYNCSVKISSLSRAWFLIIDASLYSPLFTLLGV